MIVKDLLHIKYVGHVYLNYSSGIVDVELTPFIPDFLLLEDLGLVHVDCAGRDALIAASGLGLFIDPQPVLSHSCHSGLIAGALVKPWNGHEREVAVNLRPGHNVIPATFLKALQSIEAGRKI